MRMMALSSAVLLAAVLWGCETTERCSSATCSGCCDTAGACLSASALQCGRDGAACQACGPGLACSQGRCVLPSGGGTTGGGGGGNDAGTGGGSGGTGGGSGGPAVLEVSPAALALTSCSGGMSTSAFQLTSRATSTLNLDLTLSDAGVFALGAVPSMLEPDASVSVPVTFQPAMAGDYRATVVASGQAMTAAAVSVSLVGTALNLPQAPTLRTGPQRLGSSTFLTCTENSPLSDCSLQFPNTAVGMTTTRSLRVENRGCQRLIISSISMRFPDPPLATFTITPTSLELGTGEVATVMVSATPTVAGTTTTGELVIRSNDPVHGDGALPPARLAVDITAP